MNEILRARFAAAHVPVRWASSVQEFRLGRPSDEIDPDSRFFIDVRTKTRRGRLEEYLLIHVGRRADVRALDIDPRRRQVLIYAREAAGSSGLERWDRRSLSSRTVVLRTETRASRLLVGMDESHLFICPLLSVDRPSTIEGVHRVLAPDPVLEARAGGLHVRRQGEWFFVPVATPETLREIEMAERSDQIQIRAPIVELGSWQHVREHRADELIRSGDRIFVRGRVRHVDHRATILHQWHEVFRNTEARQPANPWERQIFGRAGRYGTSWYD